MLKKKYRLLKETKFDKKNILTSPFFVLKFTENEKSFSRFGFVVSKRIDKRAVYRNRVKRQLRSIIESNLDKITKGKDYLIIAKKQILGKETRDLEAELLKELKDSK